MAEPHPVPERPVTVLLVEDEDLVRSMITRVLWSEGYRTLEARDGAEALHLTELAASYLGLVITDVVMPGVHGLELGRQLAQRWPSIPVLYISAYPVDDIFNRGVPDPSAPFLQKPFTSEMLLEKMQQLLGPPPHATVPPAA